MNQRRTGAPAAAAIQPFWERLPSFFLLPASVDKVLTLLLLSAGSLLAFVLPVPMALSFVIVEIVIWLTALRQAFRTMDLMAHGYVDAEAQANQILEDPSRVNLPWKMIGLLICCGLAIGVIESISSFLGTLASLFVSAAIPAILMQLCASNSFSESLSPARWWHFMSRIGLPYAVLFLFVFMLGNGAPQALALLTPLLGGVMTLPIINFVFLYFNLIVFALLGYVMYQYHEPLELAVDVEPEAPEAAREPTIDERVAAHLAAGETAAAVELAEGIVRMEPENLAAYERLHKLLGATGLADKLRQHNKRFFALALRQGRAPRALQLYRELVAAGETMSLAAADVLPLARAADKSHDTPLAIELVRGFDKRFPGHAEIPEVYFFSAQLASERLRKDDLARGLLKTIVSRYPEHALAGEATRYLAVIDRLAAAKVAGTN